MLGGRLLLTTVLCLSGSVWDFAQPGEMTQASPAVAKEAEAASPLSSPQQRARERRRAREAEREWIEVPEMTRETLKALLGDPELAVLDVTCKERGAEIARQIPGSVWRDCTRVEEWAPLYRKDQTIVVYCA